MMGLIRCRVSSRGDWLALALCWLMGSSFWVSPPEPATAEDDIIAFAVVSEPPKDKARVSAKVAIEGAVMDLKLLASDQILTNLAWKQLEICHAIKLEGRKAPEGFRVNSVRIIDGAMLPMVLQGFAGDCLLKKALEIAPLVD